MASGSVTLLEDQPAAKNKKTDEIYKHVKNKDAKNEDQKKKDNTYTKKSPIKIEYEPPDGVKDPKSWAIELAKQDAARLGVPVIPVLVTKKKKDVGQTTTDRIVDRAQAEPTPSKSVTDQILESANTEAALHEASKATQAELDKTLRGQDKPSETGGSGPGTNYPPPSLGNQPTTYNPPQTGFSGGGEPIKQLPPPAESGTYRTAANARQQGVIDGNLSQLNNDAWVRGIAVKVFGEASSVGGQLAVVQNMINRTLTTGYPDDLNSVATASGQYIGNNNNISQERLNYVREMVRGSLTGQYPNPIGDSLNYRATSYFNTPRDRIWGRQAGRVTYGGMYGPQWRIMMSQPHFEAGGNTYYNSNPGKNPPK